VVEDDAGLHASDAAGRIDLENARHVLGEVEYDGDIAALSCEGGTAAAAEHRSIEFSAEGERGEDVVGVVRENNADGHLAVIRTVGRVEGAAAVVEANVSTQMFMQSVGES